jgi:HK97 family phage prohead protease
MDRTQDHEIKAGERLDKVVSLGIVDKAHYKDLNMRQAEAGFEFDEIFVISTNTKDRMGDIVEQVWELQNYNQEVRGEISGPVLINHDSRSLPVGKGYAWLDGGKLMSGVKFASDIDTYDIGKTVAELVKQNFLKNASVGFIPKEWEKLEDGSDTGWPSYRFLVNELLEWSVVNVPANPDAQRKMIAKGFDLDRLERAGIVEMTEETHEANDIAKGLRTKIAQLEDELVEVKDISEGRKAPLKAYRNYLKMFGELMGLTPLEDEIKTIEQTFGILFSKSQSITSEPTASETETRYTLAIDPNTELGKMAKEIAAK